MPKKETKRKTCKVCRKYLKGRQKKYCSNECARKDKRGAGNKPVANDKTVIQLKHAFSIDCTIQEALIYAKISRTAYDTLLKNKPELRQEFADCREKLMLKARNTIAKDMEDPKTAKWYAERKRKKEFGTRQEVEHQGQRTFNVNITEHGNSNKLGTDKKTA